MVDKKEDGKKEKQLQEKFVEFQVTQQQISQIQKQLQQLNAQKSEVEQVQQSISELSAIKEESETLVPVCSGIFAKASLKGAKELFVNVGSNVVVKKDSEGVKSMLKKQESEMRKVEEQLTQNLEMLAAKAGKIEKELDVLIKEAKNV